MLALSTTSCEDFLDVRPKGEQVENEQFETAKGFEDAIYGVYGFMTANSLYGMDMVWGIPEVLNQNLKGGSTDMDDLARFKYKENSRVRDRFSAMWGDAYKAIGYANNILQNLEKKNPEDFDLYNAYKGEMLGVRAMLHFDLLRLFAPTDPASRGIPYVKTYNFSVKPFSTVGECFQFIIDDLLEAEKLLKDMEQLDYPRDNSRYDKFNNWRESHFNYYAAQAVLARVYWYKGDMPKAAEYAEKVIKSGKFPLVDVTEVKDHIAGVLSPKETIFGLYSAKYLDTSSIYLYTWMSFRTYSPFSDEENLSYSMSWQKIYNADITSVEQDFRKNWFRLETGVSKCLKMVDYLTIENDNTPARPELISGISLINASEMYLIAADALLSADYDRALGYFNDEITSRGLTKLEGGVTLTADRIFNEYRKEMYCEGQHWFNMKRVNSDIICNIDRVTKPGNDEVYVLPIPEEEFEYRPETNK